MKFNFKIFLVAVIFISSSALACYGQYAGLVGKWARINAPAYFQYIGVALDEQTCDKLIDIVRYGRQSDLKRFRQSFKILTVRNGVSAMVREVHIFEGKAKVTLLSGIYKGASAWIPIEWLDGNKESILISSNGY